MFVWVKVLRFYDFMYKYVRYEYHGTLPIFIVQFYTISRIVNPVLKYRIKLNGMWNPKLLEHFFDFTFLARWTESTTGK